MKKAKIENGTGYNGSNLLWVWHNNETEPFVGQLPVEENEASLNTSNSYQCVTIRDDPGQLWDDIHCNTRAAGICELVLGARTAAMNQKRIVAEKKIQPLQ